MNKIICFFNGKRYKGEAVYIDGYNGYTKTADDSMLCAIINNSAFTNGVSNLLTDMNGNNIHSENHRGMGFNVI